MKKVKTGIADFEQIEIISGLKIGEKIVTGPFIAITKNLENGDQVKLRNKEKTGKKEMSIEF